MHLWPSYSVPSGSRRDVRFGFGSLPTEFASGGWRAFVCAPSFERLSEAGPLVHFCFQLYTREATAGAALKLTARARARSPRRPDSDCSSRQIRALCSATRSSLTASLDTPPRVSLLREPVRDPPTASRRLWKALEEGCSGP